MGDFDERQGCEIFFQRFIKVESGFCVLTEVPASHRTSYSLGAEKGRAGRGRQSEVFLSLESNLFATRLSN